MPFRLRSRKEIEFTHKVENNIYFLYPFHVYLFRRMDYDFLDKFIDDCGGEFLYPHILADNRGEAVKIALVLFVGIDFLLVCRIKGRIAELTRKQETAYAGWEFDGGTVEMNREDNRLQIFFEEKPDEQTRETLKENGFRWSPKAGAWQRQLNDNAIYAADRLSCIKPLSGKSPVEIQKEARTAAKTEKKPSIRAQLAQDKEALKNAPKKAAEKTKKQDLERS